MEKCVVKKAPVVVVRSGKLALEIFRTNKENLDVDAAGDMDLVFKEVNKEKSRLSTDEGSMEDVTLHEPESAKEKVLADAFEEEIKEMDREIKKA
nr:hypothetical protein CFP56_56239 [Quercus suber]POF02324.1 hypothetical protein CFP56_73937 [Quercus suber]